MIAVLFYLYTYYTGMPFYLVFLLISLVVLRMSSGVLCACLFTSLWLSFWGVVHALRNILIFYNLKIVPLLRIM